MTAPAPSGSRRRAAMGSLVVGIVLAVIALSFVVRTLVRERDELEAAIEGAEPAWLGLAAVLAVAAMTAMAVVWRRALRLFDVALGRTQVVCRYYVGELGKYVPGGVWPVVGRGELAFRAGVRRPAAYGSVGLSLVALYLAAALAVVAGLPALLGSTDGLGPLWAVPLCLVGIACLHPAVLGRVIALGERLLHRPLELPVPPWRESVVLVACYLPAWLFVGSATWAVARSLDPTAPWAEVAVAAVLSWLVGFLLVPVPGGVGVREAVFVAAASSLEPGVAAAVALVARALFVGVDVLGALVSSAVLARASARANGVVAEAAAGGTAVPDG